MTHHIPLSVLKRSNPFNAISHTLILEQLWEVLLQFHESFPLPTCRVGGPKYLTGDMRDSLTNIFVVTHTPEKVTQAFSCSVYMCLPKPTELVSVLFPTELVSVQWAPHGQTYLLRFLVCLFFFLYGLLSVLWPLLVFVPEYDLWDTFY